MTVNSIARSSPNVSYAHFRIERISLTAAIPLLAMRTWKEEAIRLEGWGGAYSITYLGNDGVTALALDKVGDLSGSSLVQGVGTYTTEREGIKEDELGKQAKRLTDKVRHSFVVIHYPVSCRSLMTVGGIASTIDDGRHLASVDECDSVAVMVSLLA